MIDPERLRELIDYNSDTGEFRWLSRDRRHFTADNQFKNWNGRYPGTVAGRLGPKGYRAIAVLDRLYPAHRLAWLYVYNVWPSGVIDHINGDRDDNRIANLRDVTEAENSRHRNVCGHGASGRLGVTPYPYHGTTKYVARIRQGGRLRHLGYFPTVEEAAAAREAAEKEMGFTTHSGPKSKRPLKSRGFEPSRKKAPNAQQALSGGAERSDCETNPNTTTKAPS